MSVRYENGVHCCVEDMVDVNRQDLEKCFLANCGDCIRLKIRIMETNGVQCDLWRSTHLFLGQSSDLRWYPASLIIRRA